MAEIKSEGSPITDAINGKLTFEQGNNRIVGRDTNNLMRLLISAQNDDFVIKISESGVDVESATNDQLVFNSAQNIFKIVDSDTVLADFAGFSAHASPVSSLEVVTLFAVDHNQGRLPAIMMFYGDGSTLALPIANGSIFFNKFTSTSWQSVHFEVEVTTTQIIVNMTHTYAASSGSTSAVSGFTDYPFTYFVLQQSVV